MKKITQSLLIAVLAITLLNGCGKKDDAIPTPEAGNIGEIVNNNNNQAAGMGTQSASCPTLSEPVCATSKLTYRNACDAETAGEEGWALGAC